MHAKKADARPLLKKLLKLNSRFYIRLVARKNGKDNTHEFLHAVRHSNVIMFPLRPFAFNVRTERKAINVSHFGGAIKRTTEIMRTALYHRRLRSDIFAGLISRRFATGKSQKFVRVGKVGNISNLSENSRPNKLPINYVETKQNLSGDDQNYNYNLYLTNSEANLYTRLVYKDSSGKVQNLSGNSVVWRNDDGEDSKIFWDSTTKNKQVKFSEALMITLAGNGQKITNAGTTKTVNSAIIIIK